MKTKTLNELTIKNSFMFGAVMLKPENCKGLLERVLGFPIAVISIDLEKNLIYNPKYRGIRLDIYARDENQTHYNVEMQITKKKAIERRVRYYHSQIDMDILQAGKDYPQLPDSYVIFICDFDPFADKRYRYTYHTRCDENDHVLEDGTTTIFISTVGENDADESEELRRLMEFFHAPLQDAGKDFGDPYVKQLQNAVSEVKQSREMGGRYVMFNALIQDERWEAEEIGKEIGKLEGRRQAIYDLLEEFGQVPESVRKQIEELEDEAALKEVLKQASVATSMESFAEQFGGLS